MKLSHACMVLCHFVGYRSFLWNNVAENFLTQRSPLIFLVNLVSEEIAFIVQVRSGGGVGKSVILTVPKDVVNLLKLKSQEYVKCTIKKISMKGL